MPDSALHPLDSCIQYKYQLDNSTYHKMSSCSNIIINLNCNSKIIRINHGFEQYTIHLVMQAKIHHLLYRSHELHTSTAINNERFSRGASLPEQLSCLLKRTLMKPVLSERFNITSLGADLSSKNIK